MNRLDVPAKQIDLETEESSAICSMRFEKRIHSSIVTLTIVNNMDMAEAGRYSICAKCKLVIRCE